MIRVLIADDHKIVRDGLKRILAGTTDIQTTTAAMTANAEKVSRNQPWP